MKIKGIFCFIFCTCILGNISAVKVVFRLDDLRLKEDSISMRALQLFNHKEVPLTVAIVPCDNMEKAIIPTAEDSLYLTELQNSNVEIALHGLTHQHINASGEFGSLNVEEATRRILKGKEILQTYIKKDVRTFVPPFNALNYSTLEAMSRADINILSADIFNKYYHNAISYYPETLGHMMEQKGIWNAAKDAIFNTKQDDAICVVMFHAYDLSDEMSWSVLEDLLNQCKADDRVELHTFQSLYRCGIYSTFYRQHVNKLESGLQKCCLHAGVMHTTCLRIILHVVNALLHALLPLLVLFVLYKKKTQISNRRLFTGVILIMSILMFIVSWLHVLGPLKLFALTTAITIVLLCIAILILRDL